MIECTCDLATPTEIVPSVVNGTYHRAGCPRRIFSEVKLRRQELAITIEEVDEALREILGGAIMAYTNADGEMRDRTLAMSRAAEKSWIDDRWDGWSSIVIRQGLRNLSKHGVIVPKAES